MIWLSRMKTSLFSSAVTYAVAILPLCIWLMCVYGVLREVYPMPALAKYAVWTIILAPIAMATVDLIVVTIWCCYRKYRG